MKYTKDDLAKMSGFEINKELCILRGLVVAHEQYTHYSDRDENVVLLEGGDSFDFNNWNDIMPLAVEHGVEYANAGGENYVAATSIYNYFEMGEGIFFECTNPQRAIACCLILVLQEQQQ
jgi:hypothetical protein